MAEQRRRRGRPKEGDSDQIVAILARVSTDTKRRLDAERIARSKEQGRKLSMTQVVELLLKEALGERDARRTGRTQRARALGYLVRMLADEAERAADNRSWATDPFTFDMLRHAIGQMLQKLAPTGEFTVPAGFEKQLKEIGPNPSEVTRKQLTDPEWTAWHRVAGPVLAKLGMGAARADNQAAQEAARLIFERLADDLLAPSRSKKDDEYFSAPWMRKPTGS